MDSLCTCIVSSKYVVCAWLYVVRVGIKTDYMHHMCACHEFR